MKWIEIATGYTCNSNCVYCARLRDPAIPAPERKELLSYLIWGRKNGATGAWFSGGEPTLREDLAVLGMAAVKLGYQEIKMQSNGMVLSYQKALERYVQAGFNQFNVSVKSHLPAVHDKLSRRPGAFEMAMQGLKNIAAMNLHLEVDFLITSLNYTTLAQSIEFFHKLGVKRFNFWYACAMGPNADEIAAYVPRMSDVMPHMAEAFQTGERLGLDLMRSYHILRACLESGKIPFQRSQAGYVDHESGRAGISAGIFSD